MKSIAIYTRVSPGARTKNGQRQVDEALSLDAQEARCRAQIEAHGLSHLPIEVYRDEFESSASLERTAFQRLWTDVKFNRISHIYFLRFDRLTGAVKDLYEIFEEVEKRDVRLVSVADGVDTGNAFGQFGIKLLTLVREFQLEQGRARTKEVLDHMKRQGKVTGNPPYGTKVEIDEDGQKWLVPCEKEIKFLQSALYWLEHRKKSYREAARHLNGEGWRTRAGKPWNGPQLYSIIRRENK